MTITEQIQRIKTNITNAFNEVEKFNVNVTEYNNKSEKLAEAISKITVTGGGETSNTVLSPDMLNGLTFWMDSQCNTRNGFDSTKPYLENLVAMNKSTGAGYTEYWKSLTVNTFDDDGFLTLNTYCKLPGEIITGFNGSKNFTFEAVFKRTTNNENTQQIFHAANNGGFSVGIYSNGIIFSQCYDGQSGSSNKYVFLGLAQNDEPIESSYYSELNKVYYICIKRDNTNYSLYVNNVLIQTVPCSATAYSYAYSGAGTLYAGIGTKAAANTNLNVDGYTGLSLGMIRTWCRALSEEERTARFEECKNRFNIPDESDWYGGY